MTQDQQIPMVGSQTVLPPANNNTFSLANVFGVFLTLSFCLLTQPFGSLLYAKPAGVFGRIVFFFWRLNPLACLAEAVLILYGLLDAIWMAIRNLHGAPTTQVGFGESMHIAATAILLLRGHGRLPEHWRAITVEDTEQSSGPGPTTGIHEQDQEEPPPAYEPHPQPSGAEGSRANEVSISSRREDEVSGSLETGSSDEVDGFSNIAQDANDARSTLRQDANGPNTPEPYTDHPSSSRSPTVAPVAAIPSTTTVPSNSSRETSEQEEGRPQAPDNEAGSNTEFDVRNALGREVLAHFELIISLVTFISVVVVIMKLAFAIIPLYIRVAVWSMVGGWTSVQILLAISQRKEVDDIDPTTLLRTTMALEKKLHHRVAWFVLSLLLLPVFGYIAFIMVYRVAGLPFVMQYVFAIVFFAYNLVWDGGLMISELFVRAFSCIGNRKRLGQCITGLCKQVRKIRAKDFINFGVFFLVLVALLMGACLSFFECIDNPRCNPVLFTYSLWPMTAYLWLWFFFPALSFMISSKISAVEDGLKPVGIETAALIWNLFATAFIFTGTMMLYDANGTYKPGWLDWLGRLGRSIRVA